MEHHRLLYFGCAIFSDDEPPLESNQSTEGEERYHHCWLSGFAVFVPTAERRRKIERRDANGYSEEPLNCPKRACFD